MRFLLTIGGAGAQKEIFAEIIRYLLPQIKEKKAALYVNVGDYRNVWEELLKEIPEMGHYAKEHFNDWEDTKNLRRMRLTKMSSESTASGMKIFLKRYTARIF